MGMAGNHQGKGCRPKGSQLRCGASGTLFEPPEPAFHSFRLLWEPPPPPPKKKRSQGSEKARRLPPAPQEFKRGETPFFHPKRQTNRGFPQRPGAWKRRSPIPRPAPPPAGVMGAGRSRKSIRLSYLLK